MQDKLENMCLCELILVQRYKLQQVLLITVTNPLMTKNDPTDLLGTQVPTLQ